MSHQDGQAILDAVIQTGCSLFFLVIATVGAASYGHFSRSLLPRIKNSVAVALGLWAFFTGFMAFSGAFSGGNFRYAVVGALNTAVFLSTGAIIGSIISYLESSRLGDADDLA